MSLRESKGVDESPIARLWLQSWSYSICKGIEGADVLKQRVSPHGEIDGIRRKETP